MNRPSWDEVLLVAVVLTVGALVAVWVTGSHARARAVQPAARAAVTAAVRPAPVKLAYWLAECNAWPLKAADLADDGIRVRSVTRSVGRVTVRLDHPESRRRAHLVAHRLGSREAGWSVWSVRGPKRVAVLMAASDNCRVVATYTQARSWPPPAKHWLMERSTCYGTATWRGRTYRAWPCIWSTERAGQGSIDNLAAIGPGILAGGSGAAAAGFEE